MLAEDNRRSVARNVFQSFHFITQAATQFQHEQQAVDPDIGNFIAHRKRQKIAAQDGYANNQRREYDVDE
jgi:hypothetical protein